MNEQAEAVKAISPADSENSVNQPLLDQSTAGIDLIQAPSRRIWQRPALGYAFAASMTVVLLIPFPAAWYWTANIFAGLWKGSEAVFPAFVIVFCYTSYCCVLLAQRQCTPLHIDRLQLAEYVAYFAGMLGVILRLVALSHSTAETFDPKTVLGALAPFKIGLVVWGFAITVRWLAEHLASIKLSRFDQ